jgi:Flp pilus assembly pilin Flp
MTHMGRVLVGWGYAVSNRLRSRGRDRGAGFVEYAGLLLLIAGIVVAVMTLGLHTEIANAIRKAVSRVIGTEE